VTTRRLVLPIFKAGWAILVVIAMVIMTKGLWATVYIEPTSEAIAAERRGHTLIAAASVLLVALAAASYRWLATPWWTALAILAAVAVCVGLAMTPVVAVIGLLVAYPLTLAALVGGLFLALRPSP